MKKKPFKFPRKVRRVNIPFLLSNLSPWQEQVAYEIAKLRKEYTLSKNCDVDFEITSRYAMVVVTK